MKCNQPFITRGFIFFCTGVYLLQWKAIKNSNIVGDMARQVVNGLIVWLIFIVVFQEEVICQHVRCNFIINDAGNIARNIASCGVNRICVDNIFFAVALCNNNWWRDISTAVGHKRIDGSFSFFFSLFSLRIAAASQRDGESAADESEKQLYQCLWARGGFHDETVKRGAIKRTLLNTWWRVFEIFISTLCSLRLFQEKLLFWVWSYLMENFVQYKTFRWKI